MNAELTKTINTYYCNMIQSTNADKGEKTEDENIYILAFWGLLKCGYPFTVTENEPDADKTPEKEHNAEDQSNEESPARLVRISINDTIYTCEESLLASKFGKDIVSVILDDKSANRNRLPDSDDFVLPFVKFDDDSHEESKNTTEREEPVREQPTKRHRIAYIQNDPRYRDDPADKKEYDSFLFNTHDIQVTFEKGRKKNYTAIVYPVYMSTDDSLATDIFCIVSDENGNIRCAMSDMSETSQKGVTAEFPEITLIIRGEWDNGNFQSNCKVLSVPGGTHAALREKVTYVKPSNRTSSFYLRHRGADGTWLNVFPMSLLRNDAVTGLAQCVLMVEDGDSRKIYAVDVNTHYAVAFDGSQRIVEVFWSGNSLHISLEDAI